MYLNFFVTYVLDLYSLSLTALLLFRLKRNSLCCSKRTGAAKTRFAQTVLALLRPLRSLCPVFRGTAQLREMAKNKTPLL